MKQEGEILEDGGCGEGIESILHSPIIQQWANTRDLPGLLRSSKWDAHYVGVHYVMPVCGPYALALKSAPV